MSYGWEAREVQGGQEGKRAVGQQTSCRKDARKVSLKKEDLENVSRRVVTGPEAESQNGRSGGNSESGDFLIR